MIKIKTPELLLDYMSKNIDYGWLGLDNKIRKNVVFNDDMNKEFYNKYILQNPIQVYKNKIGVCWGQVEF